MDKKKENILRRLFSGDILVNDVLTKQSGYLLFLVLLALFYIGFHYNMAQTVKKTRQLEREVKNLQAEYATKASELMRLSKQSEITRMLKEQKVTTVAAPQAPPKRIRQ
jgi:cell division protein FtsL